MRAPLILPLLCGTLTLGALLPACTGDDGGGGGDPRCSEENAHYEGYATDETCLTMYDAEDGDAITIGGPNAPVLLNPTNGEIVVAATTTSLTITWDTPIDTDTSFARRAPTPSRTQARSPLATLLASLSPVSTAWAHLPPVTGAIHRVRLKGIAGHDGVATYFTSLQFLILTGHGLEHVTGAPEGEVAIEITSMYVTDNRIVDPVLDGPFQPTADTVFTID